MVRCESYKFYNELIEDYCHKHDIDINLFIENRTKNKKGIPKDKREKLRGAEKRNQMLIKATSKSSNRFPKRFWNQSKSRTREDITTPVTANLTKYSERRFWSKADTSQDKINSTSVSQKEKSNEATSNEKFQGQLSTPRANRVYSQSNQKSNHHFNPIYRNDGLNPSISFAQNHS